MGRLFALYYGLYMEQPTIFVAFGVTGDLMRAKIIPALLALHQKKYLPEQFQIIGISRKDWSDSDLRDYVKSILPESQDNFLQRFVFLQGDVAEKDLFERLAEKIGDKEALLYFSLSPALYKGAFENLVQSPLAKPFDSAQGNSIGHRIMIEKPFGRSGDEARELDTILHSKFEESQIYRVDHYLAKETLRNLPPIDLDSIVKIELFFLQKEDLEKRGAFFDATGMLRDVGQNHMLEMLGSLHSPGSLTSREEILQDLHVLTAEEVATKTNRAQWHGYQQIAGVAPNSQIETYFKIETMWRDVPLTLEAGKYMQEERKEIVLTMTNGEIIQFPIKNNVNRTEHEALILEGLQGDVGHFITSKEAALQWRFIDPIVASWQKGIPPLTHY
jgi:glucose-6-phosphate 1-dehydrogenase